MHGVTFSPPCEMFKATVLPLPSGRVACPPSAEAVLVLVRPNAHRPMKLWAFISFGIRMFGLLLRQK